MDGPANPDMAIMFLNAFKLAAITVIHALPSDTSDEVAEETSHELASEISTNAEKLMFTVTIIYTKAMEDETWSSTAVKLFASLSLSISSTIHDPNLSALYSCAATSTVLSKTISKPICRHPSGAFLANGCLPS
jgi:hypothetical protein